MADGTDLDTTLARLRASPFRARFHLGSAERDYLDARGRDEILEHARGFIAGRLAPALPRNDGKQTPMRGHPVFVAQHATATCCRGCLAKWHGIAAGRALNQAEQDFAVALVARWIEIDAQRPIAVGREARGGAGGKAGCRPQRGAPARDGTQGDLFASTVDRAFDGEPTAGASHGSSRVPRGRR